MVLVLTFPQKVCLLINLVAPSFEIFLVYKTQSWNPDITLARFFRWGWRRQDDLLFLQLTWDDYMFSQRQLSLDPCCHCADLGGLTEPVVGHCVSQTQSNWTTALWKQEYLYSELPVRRMWERKSEGNRKRSETFKKVLILYRIFITHFQWVKVSNVGVITGYRTLHSSCAQSAGWWGWMAASNWAFG